MTNRTGTTLTLCLFIDAFGWELLQRHAFLDDILRVKAPLETVFGYSSTCDPTILTGLLPREHGHFSFFYYNPQASPFASCRLLAPLPRALTNRGRVRRGMSRLLQRAYGFTGYFQIYNMPFRYLPLFDYSEKRDLYQPGGINGGQPTIFDHLRQQGVPFACSDWRRSETHNIQALAQDIAKGEIRFAYLYLAAMDGILHQYGTRSPKIAEKIAWYDAQIRRLLSAAQEKYADVRLHIFSDHGMADVTETCDLMARIDATGLRFGTDYVAVFDSTMARFWFLTERAKSAIPEALAQEKRGRILTAETLHEWGCDFPGKKYGEMFFLLDPGVLLCPGFMGETPLAGMHGYAPTDRDSRAMYAANVTRDPLPTHLTDLYCLMRREI